MKECHMHERAMLGRHWMQGRALVLRRSLKNSCLLDTFPELLHCSKPQVSPVVSAVVALGLFSHGSNYRCIAL